MKKVLLAAAVSVGALAVGSVASASAASFSGACTLSGSATFGAPLTAAPGANTYSFSASSGTCSGTLNGTTPVVNAPASATAGGSGILGCTAAESTNGTGTITVNGQTVGFTIHLAGAGTEVEFALTGNNGGAGGGHATFATGGAGALAQCAGSGVSSLPFSVQATAANLQ
jgi:hypothetical protein